MDIRWTLIRIAMRPIDTFYTKEIPLQIKEHLVSFFKSEKGIISSPKISGSKAVSSGWAVLRD